MKKSQYHQILGCLVDANEMVLAASFQASAAPRGDAKEMLKKARERKDSKAVKYWTDVIKNRTHKKPPRDAGPSTVPKLSQLWRYSDEFSPEVNEKARQTALEEIKKAKENKKNTTVPPSKYFSKPGIKNDEQNQLDNDMKKAGFEKFQRTGDGVHNVYNTKNNRYVIRPNNQGTYDVAIYDRKQKTVPLKSIKKVYKNLEQLRKDIV